MIDVFLFEIRPLLEMNECYQIRCRSQILNDLKKNKHECITLNSKNIYRQGTRFRYKV